MRVNYKWLLVSLAAIVLIGATTVTYKQNQVKEVNLNNEIQQLKEQSKARSEADKQKLQKRELELQQRELELQQQVRELNEKLQSKAAEKARIAAETAQKASLAQKATSAIVPTANASQVPQNASGDVQSIIVKWANHYGVSAQHMLNIARCESTFDPNARNTSYSAGAAGNPVGLFQHVEGYWPARAAKYGVPGASIYDADAQARVTAAMFADGQAHLWECR